MKLYIAEKPSLGRAIAQVLPGPMKVKEGHIVCGHDHYVTWCVGHLLELGEPQDYDSKFKSWRLEHLPIIPHDWQLKVKRKTAKQFSILKQLLKQAHEVIHAGDPDREGQLLVDQVIYYSKMGKKPVYRCLINDLNPNAVKKALLDLRPNADFKALSISALARSRADWLYGINMTRAYTLQGRKANYPGVLSVGRVQTPLLGLIVRRDLEIENFVSKPYYEVNARIYDSKTSHFEEPELLTAKWVPSDACLPFCDEERRVLSKGLAENVVKRITDQPAEVILFDTKKKSLAPPLPYNLSALQIDAALIFQLKAQEVLDICQELYEKHKLITYPRSDNRYLTLELFERRKFVLDAVSNNLSAVDESLKQANINRKTKAWNDKKVDAHHAIIPTEKRIKQSLSDSVMKVYLLICRQFLYQFYDNYEYLDTRVELLIAGGKFITKGLVVENGGWKNIANVQRDLSGGFSPKITDDKPLPKLKVGTFLHCHEGVLLEKRTQPPQHFTDATLLSAMTGIARFVKDQSIRKILRETDGIGTEATRAGIIELLFKRGFLTRQGKKILSTSTGRVLVQCLPESATVPDMTAQWEAALIQISGRKATYESFMEPLEESLKELIDQSHTVIPKGLSFTPVDHFHHGKKKPFSKRHARRK